MAPIFYFHIFSIPYKTQQRQAFWMTHTLKNLKTVSVEFFGKIESTLVADLANVIEITLNQFLGTCESILLVLKFHKQ